MKYLTQIRKLTTNEIPLIRRLALEIWPKAFEKILTPGQIGYMIEMMYSEKSLRDDHQRGVEFFVMAYAGQDCGYAAIEKLDDKTYKLHKIYLSQNLQGKGLGKCLLEEMENVVRNYGASGLKLNVNRENKAVDFYKSQGYKCIRLEDIDIGNGFFMNDYVMAKDL